MELFFVCFRMFHHILNIFIWEGGSPTFEQRTDISWLKVCKFRLRFRRGWLQFFRSGGRASIFHPDPNFTQWRMGGGGRSAQILAKSDIVFHARTATALVRSFFTH